MGQTAKALGAGASFDYEGKTYTLAPWSFKVRAKYEQHLERQALAALRRQRQMMTDDEYERALKLVMRDVTTGVYTFGSDEVARSLQSVANITHLVHLMLQDNHPDVTSPLVEKMTQTHLSEILDAVNVANADPNAKAPAAPWEGSPAPAP